MCCACMYLEIVHPFRTPAPDTSLNCSRHCSRAPHPPFPTSFPLYPFFLFSFSVVLSLTFRQSLQLILCRWFSQIPLPPQSLHLLPSAAGARRGCRCHSLCTCSSVGGASTGQGPCGACWLQKDVAPELCSLVPLLTLRHCQGDYSSPFSLPFVVGPQARDAPARLSTDNEFTVSVQLPLSLSLSRSLALSPLLSCSLVLLLSLALALLLFVS